MRSLPARAAAAAFVFAVAAVAGCGSIIAVPDQGVVVLGCRSPASCFVSDCSCLRGDVDKGYCSVPQVCANPLESFDLRLPADVHLSRRHEGRARR